ncbi:hypothetical protein CEE44_00475 [Candidatus Woesearchaeota archaeon B3_Woes]|nr:MAG: hypothetical protein CEE44_00475 [Candidatus Woesearchaeota archaeon B3_Woes]
MNGLKKFKMIKAIIFDFDNVVISSIKQVLAYDKLIFKHFNIKFPKGKKQRLLYTLCEEDQYPVFFSSINKKEFLEYKHSIDFRKYLKFIKISKNTKTLFRFLKNNGYKIAIVTNRSDTTYQILDYFKIKGYFDVILTSEHMKKHKPDPYPINLAVKKLGLRKSEVLYVGDDKVDIEAGKKARVDVIMYKNKFKGADYYINSLKQIKKILGDLNV